jgi:hypothetical protein
LKKYSEHTLEAQNIQMKFEKVVLEEDRAKSVKILNESHFTVAEEFNFSKQKNPTNNAFIDKENLKTQLSKGIDLYLLTVNNTAIEKSSKEQDTYTSRKYLSFRNIGIRDSAFC